MKKSVSLRRQLTFLMTLLVILQSVALVVALLLSRVFFLLDAEAFRLFTNTTSSRVISFNQSAGRLIGSVTDEAAVLNETLNLIAARYQTTADELYQNDAAYQEAAISGSESLVALLNQNNVTGAFFLLNQSNTNKAIEDAHSGVYIRNSAPNSAAAGTGNYLLEMGPISVSQQYKIPASINWQLDLQFGNERTGKYSFFYGPVTAASREARVDFQQYGYWSKPVTILNDNQQVIYYTVPIYDADDVPYGVFGIELSLAYFTDLYLPNREIPFSNSFYAIAPLHDEQLSFSWNIPGGPLAQVYLKQADNIPLKKVSDDGLYEASLNGLGDMYLSVQPLKMYGQNSPFLVDSWYLTGFVPQNMIHETSSHVRATLISSLVITSALSFAAIFVLVYIATRKITGLSAYVEGLSPVQGIKFKSTGFKEVDDLTSAVERLNKQVLSSLDTTKKVLELTSLPLGMFEVSDEIEAVILTDYIYSLLGLDREKAVKKEEWEAIFQELTASAEYGHDNVYHYHDQWLRILEAPTDTGRVGIIFDVTENMKENKRLIHELDFDALTHLYNRTAFKREVHRAIHARPNMIGAMIFADLDNLKYINDTYGHDVGDQLLTRAGEMYGNFNTYGAIAARISGDEFAVYLHGFKSKDEIRKILKKQLKENEDYSIQTPDGSLHRIRASTGVAWYPDDSGDVADLLKLADFAMYESKRREKGSIHEFDTKIYQEKSFLLKNRESINQLLDEGLIRFAFQPIVDLRTGEIYAYEALMRPLMDGFKSPLEILSVAADQSKLAQLERLVWLTAFRVISENRAIIGNTKIFINSIASQCIDTKDRLLLQEQYGDLFPQVVIEITEAESNQREVFDDKISLIRSCGMMLAIDDYGSGYSNDLRVLAIDPDIIKIDMEMIQGIDKNSDKQKLVENLISFSHQKNVKLVAEGVEEQEELQILIEMGVDYVQGYYMARPDFDFVTISEDKIQEIKAMSLNRNNTI